MNTLTIILSGLMIILTVFGDWLIKIASLEKSFSGWKLLFLGCLIYGLTGIGWFFIMRKIKLSAIGVIYGVGCIILLALIGLVYFKENLKIIEIVGILLGILSMIILMRFS